MEDPNSARFCRISVGGLRVSRSYEHQPVLVDVVADLFRQVPPGVVVDGTVGGGGHIAAIAERGDPSVRFLGIDRDPAALEAAAARLGDGLTRPGGRVTLVRGDFRDIADIADKYGGGPVTGVLLDLGVSSHQLDVADRGFSYSKEALLDMRMDTDAQQTAADYVAECSEDELRRVLAEYGEERFARRVAAAIVSERERSPITTTTQLAAVVTAAIPAATRRHGPHPARRTFQALRIALNDELGALQEALRAVPDLLAPHGRVAVIAYHSLEDRIVKRFFCEASSGPALPRNMPVTGEAIAGPLRLLTRKPIRPTPAEIELNPRADSARLRVAERRSSEDRLAS